MAQHQHSSLPVFWLAGKVISLYEDSPGQNAVILEITKVFGMRNAKYCMALEKSTAVFSGDNMKKASELSVNTKLRRIDLGNTLGHDLTDSAEVAILCDYQEGSDMPDLGLSVRGWNHLHVFNPLKREVDRLNRDHYQRLEEAERRIELLGKMPVQLWLPNGTAPIVTASVPNLARVFQYRAWPDGVIWKHIGKTPQGKTVFVEMPAPAMPRKPSVDIKAPDFKNPVLDQLVASVQHIEPRVTVHVRPEEHVMQYEPRNNGGNAAAADRSLVAKVLADAGTTPLATLGSIIPEPAQDKVIPMPQQDKPVKVPNRFQKGRKPQPVVKKHPSGKKPQARTA